MIDYVLDAALEAGAKDIKVIANPHHAEVAGHLDERGIAPTFQREPKGTAHALLQIAPAELAGRQVLVLNGDSPLLTAATIRKVIDAHLGAQSGAAIASVIDPTRNDGRIIRDAGGAFERIVERKDATDKERTVNEFNVGVYCFDGTRLMEALTEVKADNQAGEYYLTDVLTHLKPVTVVPLDDPMEAMGVKDRVRLAAAAAVIRRRILDRLMLAGVTIVDPTSTFVDATVTIGQDTVVEPFTVLKGNTVIGATCRIGPFVHLEDVKFGDRSDCGPFAKLRPGTEIAEDVHIGSFAELVRTRVGRGSKVPHVSYLGDADLGEGANIGAGTITANFDGTNKNRTRIGDGAFVGVDTMLVAPVKLGRGARTGAGSVVTKDVPDGATAVGVPARVVRRKPMSADSTTDAR